MPPFVILLTFFISKFLLSNQLLCGSNNIEHCLVCNYEDEICAQCEDKYFPSYGGGLECLRCNDEKDGQTGCEGKCDASRIIETRIPLCEENGCKEGYYNVQGICYQCSIGSAKCIKCSYEALSPNSGKVFKCLECEGGKNGDYRPGSDGKCYTCFIYYCEKNEYIPGTDDCVCKKCIDGYYLSNSNHQCSQCGYRTTYYEGGYCREYYCPDDGKDYSSTKTCTCYNYYALSKQNTCVHCPNNCQICHSDENDNLICTQCKSHYLLEGNQCIYLESPPYCSQYNYQRFNNINEFKCRSCSSYYILDETINRCKSCPNHCPSCYFDNNNQFCSSCDTNYVLNQNKLCENCSNNEEIGGEGCLECKYENGKNKCTKCRDDYIFIENDLVCKPPSEINLNNICERAIRWENNDYSCTKCRKGNYTLMTNYNNTKDCYISKDELFNCVEGYEDINGKKCCNKCIYNYRFTWSEIYEQNICDSVCEFDSFFNNNLNPYGIYKGCIKCDNFIKVALNVIIKMQKDKKVVIQHLDVVIIM